MGFLFLKKVALVGTLVLTLLASHRIATAQAVKQSEEQIQEPTTEKNQTPPVATPSIQEAPTDQKPTPPESNSQTGENSEPDAESEPPPTDEEKTLVQRLLVEANSRAYKTRRSAQLQLIQLDGRLPVILEEVGPPESLEAKAAVRKALRRLDHGRFTRIRWRLKVWPEEGESLSISDSTIDFNEDKSFVQSGRSAPEPETWNYNKKTKELTLSLNGGYAIYTGTADEDGNFVGTAKNIQKKTWHFKLESLGR